MSIRQDSKLRQHIQSSVSYALAEDIHHGDVTAQLIDDSVLATATVITRENAILCGQAWVEEIFRQLDSQVKIEWLAKEGELLSPNQAFLTLTGPAHIILTGERAALNFIQTLSGTATATYEIVSQIHQNYWLLDTRKTIPGLRLAQKYAVTVGGGHNHRIGLYDMFLIKENHIEACGGISKAIESARQLKPDLPVEVEVETLAQLDEALDAGADYIMVDNFTHNDLLEAYQRPLKDGQLELSGGLDLASLQATPTPPLPVRVSMGGITKHLKAVDLSLRLTRDQ